jgi:aspartyl-tRNA synthetase
LQLDFLGDLKRTLTNGALRATDEGQRVTLMGWVNRRRDLGNLIFIDLRDRTGITQIVFDPDKKDVLEKAAQLRSEYVVAVTGRVKKREGNTVNKKIPTGEIEVVAEELRILNESKPVPFSPGEPDPAQLPNEEVRLKYRYLDLRRTEMQGNMELRHKVALAIRNFLNSQGFFEIETPFMTRSTPEGARDYLVPSRVHPGQFYALPQSPQLFKQILMISGFDKYFQIVRCFRDEDLRADRQPEFTQIDLEMTYPQQESVFKVVEGFLKAAFAAAGVELPIPFPRMTYDQAMQMYGSDKPDLRLPAMVDVKSAFTPEMMQTLGIAPNLPVVAIRIPKVGELSRKERDEIKPLFGDRKDAKLFDDFKRLEKSWPDAVAKIKTLVAQAPSPVKDSVDVPTSGRHSAEQSSARPQAGVAQEPALSGVEGAPAVQSDDLLIIIAGGAQPAEHKSEGGVKPEVKQHDHAVYNAAGALRVALGQKYAERHKLFAGDRKSADSYRWLWVTDFPMFEYDAEGQRWAAAHHPFTSPHERDMPKVLAQQDLGSVRALAYDVVLNGTELGSGSIRIHRQDVQRQIFRALGMTEEEAKSRFGFFLEALEYGTPPHGGIALGLDRIVMILAGAQSLREVIPFPKTAKAVDMMVDAPTPVSEQQLKDLGIAARKRAAE